MVKKDDYICDKCSRIIVNRFGKEEVIEALETGRLIVELSRVGRQLHYCSETCCIAHRGAVAGKNRLRRMLSKYPKFRFPGS